MRLRGPVLGLSFFIAGLVVIAVAMLWMMPSRQAVTNTASLVGGSFRGVDQDGKAVTEAEMKGKPFLVFFGFTHCPDVCPTTLFELSQALNGLGPRAEGINALFVTVDPERDTPEVLQRYLSSFNPRIRGITGDTASVEAMVKTYRAYAKKVALDDGSYTMDHTALVYIMDRNGGFVRPLNMQRPTAEIVDELRTVL
ncbi:SCO family protein [Terrihabitans rhizophilus]|uniref:SCO family protein n=1 Tax=Terrihabitans rhizophilus TaxID=3092662 RepID=A0ABU4RU44_9HYPH|nr:SCO family protein [Terrihabitans sp. PJ23]MDX6806356.1 SCO family protein [Terrihabitans sp. PJ23]